MAYDFDGERYRQASTHQEAWGMRLITELSLQGDELILDLGSGDGRLTVQLAELVPHGKVIGIDCSAGMLQAAAIHTRDNLQFRYQDINTLNDRGCYDLVFSNAALHLIHDHARLLAAVYSSLSPRGILRFNFAAAGNCETLITVLHEVMSVPEYHSAFANFTWPWYMPTVDAYNVVIRQLPFHEVSVWGEIADRFFPNTDALVAWIDQPSLVPFLAHLPNQLQTSFRGTVVDRMITYTRQTDGRCFEKFRRLNVLARK